MTIVPNFLVTGILVIIFGLIVAIGAAAFVQKKYGGLLLILLSIIMLLVGGGLILPIFGVIAGIVGTRIKHSMHKKESRASFSSHGLSTR